jgi:hypothetical protein
MLPLMAIRLGITVMHLTMGLASAIRRIATIAADLITISEAVTVGEVGIAGAAIMADGVAEVAVVAAATGVVTAAGMAGNSNIVRNIPFQ